MPIMAWLTLALLVLDAIARRRSEYAKEARVIAHFPLWCLALPAIASWVVLMMSQHAWQLQALLFVLQLVLVVTAVRRYQTWPWVVLPLSAVLVLWSGLIAQHQFVGRTTTVGHRSGMDGGFTQNVSAEFKKPELHRFYARLMLINQRGELNDFTCGDPPPRMEFELTLEPEGEWNERLVDVAYSPKINEDQDRCVAFGLSYVVEQALAEVDHGPPIDYGYRRFGGKKQPPYVSGPPRPPICLCDLRDSGHEWVAFSEKQAAELRARR